MQQQANVLEVNGLNVFYDSLHAVKNISFSVFEGEIFGLLGPNGAGKTSTLSAIEGLVKAASGNVTVAGYDAAKHPLEARANMGMQLQFTSFQPELNVEEIIRLYGALHGLKLEQQQIAGKLDE